MRISQVSLLSGVTALASVAFSGAQAGETGTDLQMQAKDMLERCQAISESCMENTKDAAGILVFPEVLKADLIVGGAGGNGVLMVDGQPVGYYDIGKASIGLQAGIDEKAMVYVFRDEESLASLTDGEEWEVGINAGVTLITANADAVAETGEPLLYAFDADGLVAEFNINTFRIWEDPENAGMAMDDDEMMDVSG